MSRISWVKVIIRRLVKSLIANAVTKSNTVIEAYVGSAVTIDNSTSVLPTPSISKQKNG